MKHMIKMQTKTMIENCSFALLINYILRKMNLNNRNNMSTMNCTSDINTDYCMSPIKKKKKEHADSKMKMLLFHAVNGIIRVKGFLFLMFAGVRQEQSIYRDRLGVYQRHGDSIAEPGDDSAAKLLGKSDPKNPKNWGIRWGIFELLEFKESIICKKSFVFGVHFGLEYNCTVFVSKPCVYLSPGIWVMDACWFSSACGFGTVRHWTTKNRWFQKLDLPSLKHTMSMIGKADKVQWCIFDDPMVLPSLKQFSFADLEGVPAYSQGGVWLKLTKGGSSSNPKVPRKNETKVDTINQHEDVSVTSQ